MNNLFKNEKTLWISVAIICLLCATGLLFFMFQEKAKRTAVEEKLVEAENAKRQAETILDKAELKIAQLRDQRKLMQDELEQEKNNYQLLLQETGKKDAEIKDLETTLQSEKKERTDLANALAKLKKNYNSLTEKLKEVQIKDKYLKKRLTKFMDKAGIKLDKIVVQPQKSLSGKVLVVNKEFHFLIIDLGRKDGVNTGDEFVVYNGSKEIAKVQIEKVYTAMSTASIVSGSQIREISKNDIVKSF